MENKSFGHYTILKRLGVGGMATVYLADDTKLERKVALKLLPLEYKADASKDSTHEARFLREARAAAGLNHPNIITVFEVGEFDGQPFIAMEHIDGPTISDLITDNGKVSISESVRIITRVLDTLETSHRKKIYHRDIKPSNIMLDDANRVRVIDFGIAKGQKDPNLTQAGSAFGTPAYMAPEQFSSSDISNVALVDIYAAGVTFYYMMCGKLPFEGDNPYVIRDAKLKGEVKPPSEHFPNISPQLDHVIMKSLATNPEDRYQSAEEMIDAIEIAVSSDETIVLEPLPPRPTETPKWMKTGLAVAATFLVAIVSYMTIPALQNFGCEYLAINCPEIDPPNLLEPYYNTTREHNKAFTFRWLGSDTTSSYLLQYGSDSLFANPVQLEIDSLQNYTVNTVLESGQYFWRVKEISTSGDESEFSESIMFTILEPEEILSVPNLLEPPDGSVVSSTRQPTFKWSNTAGIGGSYIFETSEDKEFSASSRISVITTSYTPSGSMSNNKRHFWRVQAISSDSTESEMSGASSFVLRYKKPVAATGTIVVNINEASSIYLNDALIEANTKRISQSFPPGTYNLTVKNPSSNEKQFLETFDLVSNKTVSRNYSFTFPTTSWIRILSMPTNAQIYIDDKIIKEVTPNTVEIGRGNHVIKVISDVSRKEMKKNVSIAELRSDTTAYIIMFKFDDNTITFK